MRQNRVNRWNIVLTAALAMQMPAYSQTDISNTLPNFDFSQGWQSWNKRTDTASVYAMTAAQGAEPGVVSLTVSPNDPEKDRAAVYYNRTDLPTAGGYYRLTFFARSALTAGRGGLSISSFGAENKMLLHTISGRKGLTPIRSTTDWTEYETVFQVPANTTMTVLQLELVEALGTVSFRNAKLEQLETKSGEELLKAQGKKLVKEPYVAVPDRTPQYPLKTQRMIYSDADIARARANIMKYPQAKKVLDELKGKVEQWMALSDQELLDMMPDARVPRAFDMSAMGCPVHGAEVFKKGGFYPWILDPKQPFKVKCPIGDEIYPSNDYAAYYKSGFKDKKGWDTEHVDDGWGWVAPDGERYWFVAYANHHMWFNNVMPAIRDLARAYLLTGDKKYAHKSALMLTRLAEIYPSMDHVAQSRFGMIARDDGYVYGGKIVNHIWETMFADDYAEAYDGVWDSIDGDTELQKSTGKTGQQLRSLIEANLLEEAVDAYKSYKIDGNFGMHQNALLLVLLARQQMDNAKYYKELVDEPGSDVTHTGLRYALYNQLFRDGMPYESPYYNTHWIVKFSEMGELLKKGGYDLFSDQRMKAMFDSPLEMILAGKFTPDWGDTGYTLGGTIGVEPDAYRVGYDAYKEPRYLPWLASVGQTGANSYATFGSLFRETVPETAPLPDKRVVAPMKSSVLAGYGLGLLRNSSDTTGLVFTYGHHGGHAHWDFLNIDLFANGQKMMPDIGYPDAMNERVKELFTWGVNTVAHNTVVVDAKMQRHNALGELHSFADGAFARSIDASADAYPAADVVRRSIMTIIPPAVDPTGPQTTEYRRNLVMVDVEDKQSYVVDFFRVTGGKQHDYSLHGPPGEVSTEDGAWSEKKPGTLAGPDVKVGDIYDNKEMGAEGYPGTFTHYMGSGFQYLYNVQELEKGQGSILYKHMQDNNARLRIRLLPTAPQQVFIADAYDRPRAKNYLLKYVIARRQTNGPEPLKSTFVSVLEPHNAQTYIQSSQLLPVLQGKTESETAKAVEVKRAGATDVILSDTSGKAKTIAAYGIETDADSAVVTFDGAGAVQRVFFNNGTYLRCKGQSFKAKADEGTVTAVDVKNHKVTVRMAEKFNSTVPIAERIAHFTNKYRTTIHPLEAVSGTGREVTLQTKDSLLLGRARISEVSDKTVASDTTMPLSPLYNGVTMLTDDMRVAALVENFKDGKFRLANAPSVKLNIGDDIWISNLGVGDKVQLKSSFSWQLSEKK
jgi:hypothetical protein